MKAYARLLRLSNSPTAVADVWMGMVVATGSLGPVPLCLLLTLASLMAYHGGMVLNDAVDAERDAQENRDRPIAGGEVSLATAWRLAWALLLGSVLTAAAAAWLVGSLTPLFVAMLLVASVVAYNTRLKRTAAGPVLMGVCRALNGLLGMSPALTMGVVLSVAPGVLLYVAGLTLFARDEAAGGSRRKLAFAIAVSLAGVAWLAAAPWLLTAGRWPVVSSLGWWLLWGVVTLMAFRGFAAALLQPTSRQIQRAIGRGIQGIVLIDAALAMGYAGQFYGLAVLALLPIVMLLGQKIPQT